MALASYTEPLVPFDILDLLIHDSEHLSDNHATLRNMCLLSKSMVSPCRRLLFRQIHLYLPERHKQDPRYLQYQPKLESLRKLLEDKMEIRNYVQDLSLSFRAPSSDLPRDDGHDLGAAYALLREMFPDVKTFKMSGGYPSIPDILKYPIDQILSSPLTCLNLCGVYSFPIACIEKLLAGGLKELHLYDVSFSQELESGLPLEKYVTKARASLRSLSIAKSGNKEDIVLRLLEEGPEGHLYSAIWVPDPGHVLFNPQVQNNANGNFPLWNVLEIAPETLQELTIHVKQSESYLICIEQLDIATFSNLTNLRIFLDTLQSVPKEILPIFVQLFSKGSGITNLHAINFRFSVNAHGINFGLSVSDNIWKSLEDALLQSKYQHLRSLHVRYINQYHPAREIRNDGANGMLCHWTVLANEKLAKLFPRLRVKDGFEVVTVASEFLLIHEP